MAKIISYLSGISNGYFLIEGDAVIAVDTGCEEGDAVFEGFCEKAGIRCEDIRLIIISHGHVDHFSNILAMKKLTGAPILCHREAAPYLQEGRLPDVVPLTKLGQAIFARQEETGPPCGAAPVIEPDIIIGDEPYDLVEWGIDGKIYYTPGHSRHDLSVVLREEDGTLAALVGDLYADPPEPEFHGNPGPAYFTYPGGTYEGVMSSIHKLLDLGVTTFYSGHGGPFDRNCVETTID